MVCEGRNPSCKPVPEPSEERKCSCPVDFSDRNTIVHNFRCPFVEYTIGECVRDLTVLGGTTLTKSGARKIIERLLENYQKKV